VFAHFADFAFIITVDRNAVYTMNQAQPFVV
jgi:hypothetical protein